MGAGVLTKTRNNLKRPETTFSEPEMTWNNLQRPETTHNEQDTAYSDLNLPTTSKRWCETTKKKADFEIILQYGAIGSLL